jgi:hypothetical protein
MSAGTGVTGLAIAAREATWRFDMLPSLLSKGPRPLAQCRYSVVQLQSSISEASAPSRGV